MIEIYFFILFGMILATTFGIGYYYGLTRAINSLDLEQINKKYFEKNADKIRELLLKEMLIKKLNSGIVPNDKDA